MRERTTVGHLRRLAVARAWARDRAVRLLALRDLMMGLREEVEPVGGLGRLLLLLLLKLLAEASVGA
jgi:hypothetical protein